MNPNTTQLFHFSLQLADTALILGHRLSEWCSRAPTLEIDMALSNMALDLVGQSRNFYQFAAQIAENGATEDTLAYLRDAHEYRNILLVETENGDFAHTVVRQFCFSAFCLPFYQQLAAAENAPNALRGAAEKAVKEMAYHRRWSSEWVIRLGDGTPESRQRTERAIQDIWRFCGEMWSPSDADNWATQHWGAPDFDALKNEWNSTVRDVFERANLAVPPDGFVQKGGKNGNHTERLGYILAEMQFLQRAYPNSEW